MWNIAVYFSVATKITQKCLSKNCGDYVKKSVIQGIGCGENNTPRQIKKQIN